MKNLLLLWVGSILVATVLVVSAVSAAPTVNEAFPNCPEGADNCGTYMCNGLFASEANQAQKDYCASKGITLQAGETPPEIQPQPSDGLQHGCEDWTNDDYSNKNQYHTQTDLDGCKYVRDNILPFVPNEDYFVPIPRRGGTAAQSDNANKFCAYYQIPEDENLRLSHAYSQFEVASMCRLGYEVGFGKNKICNDAYLRRFTVDYSSSDQSDNNYQRDRLRKLESVRVSACQDGYTQYTVDYWSCDGNAGCQKKLRLHPANVINPGDPPKRKTTGNSTVNPTKAIPGLVTLNNAGNDKKCGSVYTAYFVCSLSDDPENTGLWQTLQTVLNILLTLVTVAAVGGLAYGGMRYAASRDDPGELNEAKNFIRNVIVGLVIFMLIWAIIEYVIPGGIIS